VGPAPAARDAARTPRLALAGALDPTGQRLALACPDGSAHVFDLTAGRDAVVLPGGSKVFAAAFAPDGHTLLVTRSDGAVARIPLGTAGAKPVFAPDPAVATAAALSAQAGESELADGAAAPLGPAGAQLVQRLEPRASAVAVAGNGATAIAVDETPVSVLLTSPGGQPVALRDVHSQGVVSLGFSPDASRLVTTDAEGRTRVWNARDGAVLVQIPSQGERLLGAGFSGDGHRLAISLDGEAQVWDVSALGEGLPRLVEEVCSELLPHPAQRRFPRVVRSRDPLFLELWSEEGLPDDSDLCVKARAVVQPKPRPRQSSGRASGGG
jgi:WD40 repeat protein